MSKKREDIEKDINKAKETFWERVTSTCIMIPLFIAFAGFLVFIFQCFQWLKEGQWTPLSASLILAKVLPTSLLQWLANDDTSWLGVKKIIFNIFEMSLTGFLLLFALVVFIVLAFFMIRIYDLSEKSKKPKDAQKQQVNRDGNR